VAWPVRGRTGVRVVILVLLLDFAVFVVPVALVNALIVVIIRLGVVAMGLPIVHGEVSSLRDSHRSHLRIFRRGQYGQIEDQHHHSVCDLHAMRLAELTALR
jgi:hypothetical protein